MHIPLPSFERLVLLLVLLFVAAVHLNLMPKALTAADVQPALKQLSEVINQLNARVKALEVPAPVVKEAEKK